MTPNLELRRQVAEIDGWTVEFHSEHGDGGRGFWLCSEEQRAWNSSHDDDDAQCEGVGDTEPEAWAYAPAYESNDGLALGALMAFGDRHNVLWTLGARYESATDYWCEIEGCEISHDDTPALAICAAITAAHAAIQAEGK